MMELMGMEEMCKKMVSRRGKMSMRFIYICLRILR